MLIGRFWHSSSQAGARVDGWGYGFEINPNNNVSWYDTHGVLNDSGIPPCLHGRGYAWLRFGYSTVTGLDGDGWRPVDWVQCVHQP